MKRADARLVAENAPRIAMAAAVLFGVAAVVRYLRQQGQGGTVDWSGGSGQRTLSNAQLDVLVTTIREALYGGAWWEDEDAAIDAILQVNTEADLFALAERYGTWAPLLQPDRDLFQAVQAFTYAWERQRLNEGLASKGIMIRF